MLAYFKSRTEITLEFGVSEGAVRNWIRKAVEKKINLQLIEINNTQYILKNNHNYNLMHILVAKGKKFRPNESQLTITIPDEVYDLLSETQVQSLMADLKANKNIPLKFTYLGEGAAVWDNLMNRHNYGYNLKDAYLLEQSYRLILDQYKDNVRFNIIDIGCGGGDPLVKFLQNLDRDNRLNSYVAMDISQSILDLNKVMTQKLLPDLNYSQFLIDFETESLQGKVLPLNHAGEVETVNIAFLLGGTLYNYEDFIISLYHIRDALSPQDKLIISNAYLNKEIDNYDFDNYNDEDFRKYVTHFPSLLGFNSNICAEVQSYNEKTGSREYFFVMNRDIDLYFDRYKITIPLKKYDKIRYFLSRKETFDNIQNTAKLAGLKPHWIIKHPNQHDVMFMLGKN